MGDERRIAWMVDRFNSRNALRLARVVLMNVLDQLGLGIGRPGDQDHLRIGNRLGNGLEVFTIFGRVSATDTIGLVMDVSCRVIRTDHQPIHLGRTEMEDAALPVIDPDDSVIMMAGHEMPL